MGISLKISTLIPKLHNDSLASCSLINFDFLLLHTAPFDKSIVFPFLVLTTSGFLFSVFFLFYTWLNFYLLLEFLISSFKS